MTAATVAADTETNVGTITIPSGRQGRIKQILYGYGSVVDAKGATGVLELKLGSHTGPFKFPVGHGNGGATSSSPMAHAVIDVDIPVLANETVKPYITLADAGVEVNVGIIWVSS